MGRACGSSFAGSDTAMDLIIGGAYQGKLDYAKEVFQVEEIFICSRDLAQLDFSKQAVYRLEEFVLACVRQGEDAKDYLQKHWSQLADKVIIGTDLSQGIVPIEAEMRAMREMNGKALIWLAGKADSVTRVFCGLGQKIK